MSAQTHQVGAHFVALIEGIIMAPLKIIGLYDRAKFILLFQKMLCLFGLLGLLVTDNPFVHIHIAYVGHKITSKEIKTDLLSIYFKQDFLTTWTL